MARKLSVARFARTLATMLASGVQLLQALDIVRSLLEPYPAAKAELLLEALVRIAEAMLRLLFLE